MEPNTQPSIEAAQPNTTSIIKSKMKYYIGIIAVIIVIIAIILIFFKTKTPVSPIEMRGTISSQTDQIIMDINSATTFDNEADLIEIDKEFQ
ncbi:MAG: hypothetical protein WCW65_03480 [Candidatus Paceibacterota bacterium]